MNKLIQLQTGFRPVEANGTFCAVDEHGHCPTCSDEALPAQVLHVGQDEWSAFVKMDGRELEVDVSLVDQVQPGAWLLVHGGVALGHLVESEP